MEGKNFDASGDLRRTIVLPNRAAGEYLQLIMHHDARLNVKALAPDRVSE